MPIYEYRCTACGRVVEKWQKISDLPLALCPACGGSLTKLISNCAFHLKGGGWYVTDYSGSRQGVSGGDQGEASKGAPGAEEAPKPKEAEAGPSPSKSKGETG
jgi:putative FmdB family regulatory protein